MVAKIRSGLPKSYAVMRARPTGAAGPRCRQGDEDEASEEEEEEEDRGGRRGIRGRGPEEGEEESEEEDSEEGEEESEEEDSEEDAGATRRRTSLPAPGRPTTCQPTENPERRLAGARRLRTRP